MVVALTGKRIDNQSISAYVIIKKLQFLSNHKTLEET